MKVNGSKIEQMKSGYYKVLEVNNKPELNSERGIAFEIVIAERKLPIQFRKTQEGIDTFIDIVSRNNDLCYLQIGQYINVFSTEEQAQAFADEAPIIIE